MLFAIVKLCARPPACLPVCVCAGACVCVQVQLYTNTTLPRKLQCWLACAIYNAWGEPIARHLN